MVNVKGGLYTAKANADGTYDIYDVPIFAELPKGEKRNAQDIDKKWMEACVAQHLLRQGEGYLAPMHVKHHGDGEQTQRAGFFLPKAVKTLRYNGRAIAALYADMLAIPAAVFESIQRGELNYRSVEVATWDKAEIASLALLDDEAPFFKFELLTVGKVIPPMSKDIAPVRVEDALAPALACHGAHLLFRMDTLAEVHVKTDPAEKEEKEEPAEKNSDGTLKAEGSEGCCPQCHKLVAEMYAMVKQGAMAQMAEAPAQPAPGKPADQPPPGGPKKDTEKHSEDTHMDEAMKKLAEAAAEKHALKAKDAMRMQADALKTLVDEACAGLKEYTLADDTKAEMLDLATKGGKECLAIFVEAYKRHVQPAPPASFSQFAAGKKLVTGQPGQDDPAELQKYAGDDARLKTAREFSKLYDAAKEANRTSVSRERWLEINMAHAG